MLFKGTCEAKREGYRRLRWHRGGQINAATDREYTMYYVGAKEDLALGMIILCDMLVNSSSHRTRWSARRTLSWRRSVAMRTCRRPRHDLLTELVWDGHELDGHSVLGTEEVIRAASPGQLRKFRDKPLWSHAHRRIAAGNVSTLGWPKW